MDFKATPRTVRDMLNLKRKYVIPRFQREYSWTNDELNELWNDLLENLSINSEGKLVPQEYFLGSIVLVGDDEDSTDITRQVVDGQQRLMTITIMFSVLAQKFRAINENGLSNIVHKFIIGEDENGDPITKLVSETPKPFFQFRIQQKEIDFSQVPTTEEEKAILNTYNFFDNCLSETKLRKEILKDSGETVISEPYVDLLKVVRDQVLSCKVIYVTVKSFDDAYQIFEVLNAKGKELEPTDIIKNNIFALLDSTEPVDTAFEKWKIIRDNIADDKGGDIKTFYRYFWLSKYSFVTSKKLVSDFNRRVPKTQEAYSAFLDELENSSKIYLKISQPKESDWRSIEKKPIYDCLKNLNDFGITQVRTIAMALLEAEEKKTISNKKLVDILSYLEYFHFVFNAVCSLRASAVERKNSRFARKLNKCTNKQDGNACLGEYKTELQSMLPSYETFEESFMKLYYTQAETSDKKVVQYILRTYEYYCAGTDEVAVANMTVEHILPESTSLPEVGYMGNLLPLGQSINSSSGDDDFTKKLEDYKKSRYQSVVNFAKQYSATSKWGKEEIINRTKYLAKCMYERKVIAQSEAESITITSDPLVES